MERNVKPEDRENLILLLYDELPKKEKQELLQRIAESPDLQAEYDALKRMEYLLSLDTVSEAEESLTGECRSLLQKQLPHKTPISEEQKKRNPFFSFLFTPGYGFAFGSIGIFCIGLLLGYAFFRSPANTPPAENQQTAYRLSSDTRIDNIRFTDADPSDGSIDFTFEERKPIRLQGSPDDETIRQVLLYSILNEQNPGVRLNSINVIDSKTNTTEDPEIKDALIKSVLYDTNTGVRLHAIKILAKYRFDDGMKSTFLTVLKNEKNSSIRIEALNALDAGLVKSNPLDQETISILKEKRSNDENLYIRTKTNTLLQEYGI